MGNLFSGLESMGLGKLSEMNIYEESEIAHKDNMEEQKKQPQFTETDFIFDKSYTCPLCDHDFKSKTVKTGKVKLVSTDTDLRPKYQNVDSLKYDVVACPYCGYAALNRFFSQLTSGQMKLIKANIAEVYKPGPPEGEILTYDDAIRKHKLTLLNTIVKKGKVSEKAFICLKLGWLMRGKRESLPEDTKNYENVIQSLVKQENEFLMNAYEGFSEAYTKELFPLCGMDEITVTYLLAELARRVGKNEEALRLISKVLTTRDASERIKEKARHIRDMIKGENQ